LPRRLKLNLKQHILMRIKPVILFVLLSVSLFSYAQEEDKEEESLLDLIEDEDRTTSVTEIFKSTRVVTSQSVELVDPGEFLFIIGHRFGTLNSGWRELFGLDNATIRLGGDFGITEKLNAGIGRSSFQQTYDAYLKYKFLEQQRGADAFPFSAVLFTSANFNTQEVPFVNVPNTDGSARLEYVSELLLGSKLSKQVSIQVAPVLVHRNFVESDDSPNTFFTGHLGGSVQVTPSTSVNAEFFVNPNDSNVLVELTNSLSLGVDIETGGHVFQLHLTNSQGLTENFLTETTGDWLDGDIFFGFNVARNFNIGKKNRE